MVLLAFLLILLLPLSVQAQTFRNASTNSGTGTAATATVPTGTTTGDIVLIFLQHNDGAGTCADNNGGTPFTEDIDTNGTSMSICFYSRRITGSEPSPYAFTISSSTEWRATAVTISDPHASIIYDAGPTTNCEASTSSPTATGLTTSSSNALVGVFYGQDSAGGSYSSGPAGYTERINVSAAQRPHWVGTKNRAAGVEGNQSATAGSALPHCSVMAAIESPASSTSFFGPLQQGF